MLIEITSKEQFDELLNKNEPMMAKFGAKWCGPCKAVQPQIEFLANTTDNVNFVSVDIDDNPELAKEYGVMSIPYMAFFKNGALTDQLRGAVRRSDIENKLKTIV